MNQSDKINISKFKIGVLLQSFKMNKFEKEIIDQLNLDRNIELFAILEQKKNDNFFKKISFAFKKNSFLRNLEIFFFKLIFFIEKFLLSLVFKNLKELNNDYIVNKDIFKKIINVSPIYSPKGLYSEYNVEDFDKITNEKIDLVMRGNVNEIFRNNKLKISRLGIISFHHGDNRWNRGGPPGFWETYYNKCETGFIIQLLTSSLDDGKVIFRGEFATKRLYTLNYYNLIRESNYNLIPLIKKVLLNKVTIIDGSNLDKPKIHKTPKIRIVLMYLFYKIKLLSNLFLKKYIFRKKQTWTVCYSRNSFDKVDFQNPVEIDNLKDRYFADPFVISKNNKKFIFVEDFSFKNNKGSISVIEIDENDSKKIYEKIIEENFHLAFPFVFFHENNLYMVPETAKANSIRLYKCNIFPHKWEYCYDLISNINCADTIIFKKDNYYYLLTSTSYYNDFSSKLEIYYADNPISKSWKPLKLNPVFFDIKNGRNGGLVYKNNEIFRVTQTYGINDLGDNQYGRKFSVNKIIQLNLEKFEEKNILNIKPDFKKNLLGTHHMSSVDKFTVFDYCKYE